MRVRKKIHSEAEQEELLPAAKESEIDVPEEIEEIPEELETDVPDDPEPEPPPKGLKTFFSKLFGKKEAPERSEELDQPEDSASESEEEISFQFDDDEMTVQVIGEEQDSEQDEEYLEYTELQDAPEDMPEFKENTPEFAMDMEEVITIDGRPSSEETQEEEHLEELAKLFLKDDSEEDADEEEDEDEDEDETPKKSFFSVAIPLAVVLVIGLGFMYCFQLGLFDEKPTYYMPDLVGTNYYDLGENYENFNIQVVQSDFSGYDKDVVYWQDVQAGSVVKHGQTVNIALSLGYQMTTVPDVRNYQFEYAQKLLEQSGFKTQIVYEPSLNGTSVNNVIRTLPASNDEVIVGSEITLYVSEGLGAEMAQVQDFTNMLIDDAIDLCEMYGLEVEAVPVPAIQAENVVVEQSLEAGTTVPFHTLITLAYSTGEQPSGIVPYQVNFPAYATGRFILDFIDREGVVIASSDAIIAGFSAGSSVPIEGIGSQEITVVLNNVGTNQAAQLGKYHFDFSTGTYSVIEEDMQAAFEAVQGIQG